MDFLEVKDFPKTLGILNLTEDSFSDGGLYLDPGKAIERAGILTKEGAYGLDLGAQSSNPDSQEIPWEEEWKRLETVWDKVRCMKNSQGERVRISIDSYKPEILAKALPKGLDYWNDITALGTPGIEDVVRSSDKDLLPRFIVMYSHNRGKKAIRKSRLTPKKVVDEIVDFFLREKESWISWGIPEENLIYDPGMGFFLGEDPELSLEVLRNLSRLKKTLGKILVSVSRKSFLGAILGGRPPLERRYASFACELYLAREGVDYIRTHEIQPVLDMWSVWKSL